MPWWRFWKPESDKEKLENARQKASLLALESGDLPPTAKDRIKAHLVRDSHFFSSDLSVREFLLTREAKIEPISQVMGTSFFNVSYWGSYIGPYRFTGELAKVTHAQMEARRVAMLRMRMEAKLLGASGVIGVRLTSKPSGMGTRMTEFTCYGTAVRIPGYPAEEEPFTSDLNGQEFWQLYKAGYRPKALVMGTCSYYVWTNWRSMIQQQGIFGIGFKNQEVDQYSQSFINARNAAMERMTQELYEHKADGAVGVTVKYDIERIVYGDRDSQVDLLINFTALGTAVDAGPPVEPQSRLMVLDLQKQRREDLIVDFN
jgi:uncharacterized protein YbjQ (UPF0145 family)